MKDKEKWLKEQEDFFLNKRKNQDGDKLEQDFIIKKGNRKIYNVKIILN